MPTQLFAAVRSYMARNHPGLLADRVVIHCATGETISHTLPRRTADATASEADDPARGDVLGVIAGRGPVKPGAVVKALEGVHSRATVYRRIAELAADGLVRKTAAGLTAVSQP